MFYTEELLSYTRDEETRELLEAAVASSGSGIVVTDATAPDNPIVYVNSAFERITGYAADETLGRNCRFLQGADVEQPALEELRAAIREGRSCTVVLRNRHKNGAVFWNELYLTPVRDEEGNVANFVGIQNDVTARLRAEEEKVRIFAEYEKIVRMLPNLMFRWGKDEAGLMRVVYCEGALAEEFGVNTDKVLGDTLEDLFPPEFLATVGPAFERAFAGESIQFSSRIGDRTFSNVARPFTEGPAGPTTEIVGFTIETTDRDRAEKARRRSEERFDAALRGSNDGIWDLDPLTGEIYFSPRCKEMLGFSDWELDNDLEEWRKRVHPEDLERFDDALEDCLGGLSDQYKVEYRMLHENDSYRWILTRGAAARDETGAVSRVAGSHTDITERKTLEERLKRQAFHDELTGLPNRTLLMDTLEGALSRTSPRNSGGVAVLFVDLDGFKEVNDSSGHDAGDRLLMAVAGRLKRCVRPGDTVARLGGDEFVVLLDGVAGTAEAAHIAGRVSEEMHSPFRLGDAEVSIAASVGVALSRPGLAKPRDLLREADLAMYQAKERGDGGYAVFGNNPRADVPKQENRAPTDGVPAGEPSRGPAGPASTCEQGEKAALNGNGVKGAARGKCSHCEVLPEKVGGVGRLYLWPPLGHTLTKVKRYLRGSGYGCYTTDEECLIVGVDDGRMGELVSTFREIFTGKELEDTRSLFKPEKSKPSAADIPRAESLRRLSALGRSDWLLDMLAESRLTSHFQPIVSVSDPEEVYAHECLLRGVADNGDLVPPGKILEASREAGVLFQTDLAARLTAIREAVSHGLSGGLFINFTPTSVYDPAFCLRSTVRAIDESGIPHENIVFEVTGTEEARDRNHLKNIVDYYRNSGFRVALDDMGSGYSSLNLIHHLRPDFIKLDMHLTRNVDRDPYKAMIAGKILEMAQGLGVETMVEGIETLQELRWAQEQGADLAQGFLISRPSALPAKDRLSFSA